MNDDNSNPVCKKVIAVNEIARPKNMTFEQIVLMLSELQDEMYAHGYEEPAMLIHRALSKMTYYNLQKHLQLRLEAKKKNEAA